MAHELCVLRYADPRCVSEEHLVNRGLHGRRGEVRGPLDPALQEPLGGGGLPRPDQLGQVLDELLR